MASKKNIERFYTAIKQEGERGAIRGKISAAMAVALGAGDGDIIEWEVQGGVVVGGQTLSKADRREYLRENARAKAPAKSRPEPKPSKKQGKKVAKRDRDEDSWDEDEDERPRKSKKTAKSNARKTKVTYEKPSKSKGKPTLKKPKLSLRGR